MGTIYCIENKVNGKKYIGQTNNVKRRFKEHKRELRKNKHHNDYLQNSYNKHGKEKFKFGIVENNIPINKLDEKEIKYIEEYNSYNNGYNLTLGGNATRGLKISDKQKQMSRERMLGSKNHNYGKPMPESTKEKLRKANKGQIPWTLGKRRSEETKRKISESLTGNKLSEETKEKLRIASTGRKVSKETRMKLRKSGTKITKEQAIEICKRYKNEDISQSKLAEDYPISRTTISDLVNNKHWLTKDINI